MIDMTHYSDNWRTADKVVLIICFLSDSILDFCTHIFCGKAKFLSNDINGLGIKTLVDTYHDTDAHAGTYHLIDTHVHHSGKLTDRHKLCQFQYFALCSLCGHLLTQAFLYGITLFLTVLGTFFILIGF